MESKMETFFSTNSLQLTWIGEKLYKKGCALSTCRGHTSDDDDDGVNAVVVILAGG